MAERDDAKNRTRMRSFVDVLERVSDGVHISFVTPGTDHEERESPRSREAESPSDHDEPHRRSRHRRH